MDNQMKQVIKVGVYVAAGVGVFEILRRYGLLARAGAWLSEQVPDDMKERARHMGEQVGDMVHEASDRVKQAMSSATDGVRSAMGGAEAEPQSNGQSGEVITGGGEGVNATTQDADGGSVPHHVGRGVVH